MEFVGVLPREIALASLKYDLGIAARELLELTDGQHDLLSESAWEAVRLLHEQINPEELLAELHRRADEGR